MRLKETLEHMRGPFWPWEIHALQLQENISFPYIGTCAPKLKMLYFPDCQLQLL